MGSGRVLWPCVEYQIVRLIVSFSTVYGSWGSEVNEGVCHKGDTPTDKHIIQKVFEEQNYLLHMNCVKWIENNDIKCILIQELTDESYKYEDREYLLEFDGIFLKLSVKMINDL